MDPKIFRISLLFLLFPFLVQSCAEKAEDCISFTENGVPVIQVEEIEKTGELKLSDIASDLHIVKLETNDNCLIDHVMRCYVTDKYIIISTGFKGIYLFSAEGKFIKTIAENGNGPGEVNDPNRNLEFSEEDNLLFVRNQFGYPGELFCFDIENDTYQKIDIAGLYQVRDIVSNSDSTLMMSLMHYPGDTSNCRILTQSFSGEPLWRFEHHNAHGARDGGIYEINDKIYFSYLWGGDTLFSVANKTLQPLAVFQSEKRRYNAHGEDMLDDIMIGFTMINDRLISGSYSIITDFTEGSRPGRTRPVFGHRSSFIFDTKDNSVYNIPQIEEDFLGSEKRFYRPQNNGYFYIRIRPDEIIELAESQEAIQDIDPKIKARVNDLAANISIDDNPILLIGKIK